MNRPNEIYVVVYHQENGEIYSFSSLEEARKEVILYYIESFEELHCLDNFNRETILQELAALESPRPFIKGIVNTYRYIKEEE